MKQDIKRLQEIDPIKLAEEVTGQSYKENDHVGYLGLFYQMDLSQRMEKLMDASDDTKFRESTEEYLRKVTEFGFEVVYEEDFVSDKHTENYELEKFYILWHKEYSILLCFDTFHGNRNSGNYYYNYSLIKDDKGLTSTGGYVSMYLDLATMKDKPNPEKEPRWDSHNQTWDEYMVLQKEWNERDKKYVEENNLTRVWSGSHDCREAIKNQIKLMAENGTFLKKWINKPHLYLSYYGDKKDISREERFEKLPQYVKDCITI